MSLRSRVLVAACAAVLLQVSAQATQLVHQYTFDQGTLQDSIGTWNGSAIGNAHAVTTGGAAQGSGQLVLDGSSYVALGNVTLPSNFSVTAWVSEQAGTPSPYIQTVVGNGAASVEKNGFKVFINNWAQSGGANGTINLETGNGTAGQILASSAGTFAAGQWHHLAFTADRNSGTGNFYYDGQLVANGAIRSDFGLTGPLNIGAFGDGNFKLRGQIDDLRIYDNTLTQAEVQNVMNSVPEPTIVGAIAAASCGLLVRNRRRSPRIV